MKSDLKFLAVLGGFIIAFAGLGYAIKYAPLFDELPLAGLARSAAVTLHILPPAAVGKTETAAVSQATGGAGAKPAAVDVSPTGAETTPGAQAASPPAPVASNPPAPVVVAQATPLVPPSTSSAAASAVPQVERPVAHETTAPAEPPVAPLEPSSAASVAAISPAMAPAPPAVLTPNATTSATVTAPAVDAAPVAPTVAATPSAPAAAAVAVAADSTPPAVPPPAANAQQAAASPSQAVAVVLPDNAAAPEMVDPKLAERAEKLMREANSAGNALLPGPADAALPESPKPDQTATAPVAVDAQLVAPAPAVAWPAEVSAARVQPRVASSRPVRVAARQPWPVGQARVLHPIMAAKSATLFRSRASGNLAAVRVFRGSQIVVVYVPDRLASGKFGGGN